MYTIKQRNLLLLITTGMCILLLLLRIYISESISYSFLVWNLILAWIPLYFSQKLHRQVQITKNWKTYFIFFSWLVFFPNAPYIVTDLIHLRQKHGIPLWFDLILIVSFVWNGLLLAFISLLEVHQSLLKLFAEKICWIIVTSILFLSGYGIYLGRFERLNSWDIVMHPFRLIHKLFENFQNPEMFPRIIGVTLGFGLFLMISYLPIYFLSKKNETTK